MAYDVKNQQGWQTACLYGPPGSMKTSMMGALAPRAILIGQADATVGVLRAQYAFDPMSWPTSHNERSAFKAMVHWLSRNVQGDTRDNFVLHWENMQPLIKPIEDIAAVNEVLRWFQKFFVDYSARKWNGDDPKAIDLSYRPQLVIDDVTHLSVAALTEALHGNEGQKDETRASYGDLKKDVDSFLTELNRMPCDRFVTGHMKPVTFEFNSKPPKQSAPGGLAFGSAKAAALDGAVSFMGRVVANTHYPDPYSTELRGGTGRLGIEAMNQTPVPPLKHVEYVTKTRWAGCQGPMLPPSMRALAFTAGHTDILRRPPGLEWLDAVMEMVHTRLMDPSIKFLDMEAAERVRASVVDTGDWIDCVPVEQRPKLEKLVPAGMSFEMDQTTGAPGALDQWLRWGVQEGLALAMLGRRPKPAKLDLSRLAGVPSVPAPPT